jgi:hypothetical protein
MTRSLRSLILGLVALGVLAAPAAANPPAGDWTFLRKDAFRHYACKVKERPKAGGAWRIRTATFINGRDDARRHGIGAYAALARGGNRNLAATRTSTRWEGAYIRMALPGARDSDRLWLQGAYYGPVEPWSDGVRVANITRCGNGD